VARAAVRFFESQAFGLSFDKPVRRLREYLTVLRSIFHDGIADFHGDEVTASPEWPVDVPRRRLTPVVRSRESSRWSRS
jgi:alkanesulfonate monooxygenase SsuD/methylene tetrahydromethanopterin reductase-like flavin-dependent oxidoreductase (luciferase family)